MTEQNELADLVFPDKVMDIKEIEAKYKPRQLKEGQMVTRFAPSPTGFLHIGAIYTAMIDYIVAKQSGGVSYLRVEDTDQKRQVEAGVELMTKGLRKFGIEFDEGVDETLKSYGDYAPYIQSERSMIYRSYAKELLRQGKAYLCFCTEENLEQMREVQRLQKQRTGYYGRYATCRNLTTEQVIEKVKQGVPFTVRIKSMGDYDKRIKFVDVIRGERYLPENDCDPIIMKSGDDLPTYHFAHVVDDHLMGTTHIIRGDEWLSSMPLHLELFQIMGWEAPRYAHIAPIQKMEDGAKRKLSKRKDPEANIEYFFEQGYPIEAVIDYLMNIINSNFEDWRRDHHKESYMNFKFDLTKTSASGALFDINKLNNISKNIISEYTNLEVYDKALEWAKSYDADFHKMLVDNEDYMKRIFNIERTGERKRKDFVNWSSLKDEVSYFFDDRFQKYDFSTTKYDADTVKKVLNDYAALIVEGDNRDAWWDKVRQSAEDNGFTPKMDEYKKNPDKYKGSIADFMKIIRLAIRGRENSPDLYEIMQVIGVDKTRNRLKA